MKSEISFWIGILFAIGSPIITILLAYNTFDVRISIMETNIKSEQVFSKERIANAEKRYDMIEKEFFIIQNEHADFDKIVSTIKIKLGI